MLWIEKGNRFIWFEEPAYFVASSYLCGTDKVSIAQACISRYHVDEEESLNFVAEVIAGVDSYERSNNSEPSDVLNKEIRGKEFAPFSFHNYSINSRILNFRFEKERYEYYLHPLLKHLETDEITNRTIVFEMFEHNNKIVLSVDDQVCGIWDEDETHLLKGMAFLQILNAVYEKKDDDWMTVIHASAVTNGKKTIAFTASPGSGKSTIAALLLQRGYSLVSDDFVPIERTTGNAFHVPIAMSVKEDATTILSMFYPSLLEQAETHRSLTNKKVKYLYFRETVTPSPVKEIIFIKYDPDVDFEMEKLPRIEALKLLLDEAWTYPSAVNAGSFLDWFTGLVCYRLTYSNNEKAIKVIDQLFNL